MGSRRSSESCDDDLQGSVDISLEYDDYPLDLISPVAKDDFEDSLNVPDCLLGNENDYFNLRRDFEQVGGEEEEILQPSSSLRVWEKRDVSPGNTKERDQLIQNPDPVPHKDPVQFTATNSAITPNNSQQVNGRLPPLIKVPKIDSSSDQGQNSSRCLLCLRTIQEWGKIFLVKYHPIPEKDTFKDRLIYGLRMPPHGKCALVLSLVLNIVVLWGLLWLFTGVQSLPGGCVFSVFMMVITGHLLGKVIRIINVPPFVGKYNEGTICKCKIYNTPIAIHVCDDDIDSGNGNY